MYEASGKNKFKHLREHNLATYTAGDNISVKVDLVTETFIWYKNRQQQAQLNIFGKYLRTYILL